MLLVDIEKNFGDFHLNIQFETGSEPLALLGASGCGKSVTLRCIAGLLTPDRGEIVLDGVPLFDSRKKINLPPQRRRVGYLFQSYALFPHMTVQENIAAAVKDRTRCAETVTDLLRRFRLEEASALRPRAISGGQQQRAALARILAAEPKAILLDEPLSALDAFLRRELEGELTKTLEAFSGPALWVTHHMGEAYRNCLRACVVDRGQGQPVCSMKSLLTQPKTLAAARLSGCENFSGVLPEGESVRVPAWGAALHCGRTVPAGIRQIGVRAKTLKPCGLEAENAVPCRILRTVRDLDSVFVHLRPEAGAADAPPLMMKLSPAAWESLSGQERITVSVSPENILLFES